jgi:uncharacterized integral membrane protein
MNVIYTVIVGIVVLFLVTFSLDNQDLVRLRYYGNFERWLPTYLLIFLSFLVGVIFTGFLGIVERFRMTRTIKRLNKTIRDLHREMRAKENSPDSLYSDVQVKKEIAGDLKNTSNQPEIY